MLAVFESCTDLVPKLGYSGLMTASLYLQGWEKGLSMTSALLLNIHQPQGVISSASGSTKSLPLRLNKPRSNVSKVMQ